MIPRVYRNASEALPKLLGRMLAEGVPVQSRNGNTKELLMEQITLSNPLPGIVTTPGRRVSLPAQIAETMWLLAGRNDIGWLSNYLPRAADFSDDGETWRGGYGPRIRGWHDAEAWQETDQLKHVVDLLKQNPDTRRAVMAIYNPSIDSAPGKDIPCNNWVHFIGRDGVLHGHIAIRSNDIMWGWSGINTFEWTQLLQIVARLTGFKTGTLTFSISSLHLYEHHFDKAKKLSQAVPNQLWAADPEFSPSDLTVAGLDDLVARWFKLEEAIRTAPPTDGLRWELDQFPEPLMRSWLKVLFAWWHGTIEQDLKEYHGTQTYYAAVHSPARKGAAPDTAAAPPRVPTVKPGSFGEAVSRLHAEKHAAYGDSWKRRGEMLGIMANLARKVDRLGVGGGGDTPADTAIDLLCYAVKYRLWLSEHQDVDAPRYPFLPGAGPLTDDADFVTTYLAWLDEAGDTHPGTQNRDVIDMARSLFDALEHAVTEKRSDRWVLVEEMISWTYSLATRLWADHEEWKRANARRRFDGYARAGEDA